MPIAFPPYRVFNGFDLGNLWHALPWLGIRIEVSEMVILVPEPYTPNRKGIYFLHMKI